MPFSPGHRFFPSSMPHTVEQITVERTAKQTVFKQEPLWISRDRGDKSKGTGGHVSPGHPPQTVTTA